MKKHIEEALRKERYRTRKIDLNKINNIREILNIRSNSFEIQMKLNNFLIWKYAVRWSLYTKVSLFGNNVINGNSKIKKKRRRMEILCELLKKLILEKKFERDKLPTGKERKRRCILIGWRRKSRLNRKEYQHN
jgi:hypothetical protein